MKEEKIGLTTTNWILSIIGIIVLTCFIVLPPVFRVFLKEEIKEKEPDVSSPVLTTTCYKAKIANQEYEDDITYIFTHQDNKLKEINKKTERSYLDSLIYQNKRQQYGKLVTAFSIIEGLDYTVTPDDNNSKVIIRENYDLKNFKASTIIIPGDTESTEVKSDYQYNESITNIINSLKTNAYVCE